MIIQESMHKFYNWMDLKMGSGIIKPLLILGGEY